MRAFRTAFVFVLPAMALLAACGGSGDDANKDDKDEASNTAAGGATSPGGGASIPAIKEGNFLDGTVTLQVSGEQDFKFEGKGNGVGAGGIVLLTYATGEATVLLSFQSGSKDEPGALSITTAKFATAAEWGEGCTVSINDSASEVKGEFTCNEIDAVDLGSAKAYKIRVTGKFSAKR